MSVFPKYERYKDSGVDWLGEIPEHWEAVPNRALLTEQREKVGKYAPDFLLLSLTLKGVIPRNMENPQGKFPAEFNTYTIVKPDDLVFCLFDIDETPRAVGHARHHGMITGAYNVYSPTEKINPGYLFYYYLFLDADKRLKPLYTGLRKTIQRGVFGSAKAPLPPKPEQDRIVAFLDQKTAEIDALIAKKQRQIELLDEQKAILINRAVTRGLNPNAKLKPSGIEWIPEIPIEWEILPLKRVAKVQGGYAFPAQAFGKVGIPVIRMSNLKRGSIDLSDVACIPESLDHPRYRLREGDLCYGLSGSVGATGSLGNYAFVSEADLPCLLNQRVARFVPQVDKISSAFLALIIQTSSFYSQILLKTTGTAQFNVSTGDVEGALVQLPPLIEQVQIVAAINKIETGTARVMSSVDEQIQSLKTLRSTLIAHAVTGRIKV